MADLYGEKPTLNWLPIDALKVDAKYQRDTASRRSQNLIQKIADNFLWSRFVAVLVVKHNGGYHVIDGQHRVEAARLKKLPKIPAIVLPHATIAEAAADFVAINRDRVAVTPLHIHHAQLAASDPEAVAVEKVCKAAGITICRYPVPSTKMKPHHTLAVQTIARLLKLQGEDMAIKIMTKVRKEGNGAPGAISAPNIRLVAGGLLKSANYRPEKDATLRACMSCGVKFPSAGAHNRLCIQCRSKGDD